MQVLVDSVKCDVSLGVGKQEEYEGRGQQGQRGGGVKKKEGAGRSSLERVRERKSNRASDQANRRHRHCC